MNALDAFAITAPGLEGFEDREDIAKARRDAVYFDCYGTVPERFRGSLLLEAVNELGYGNGLNDRIVDAYAKGDDLAMACALRTLLNGYRREIAERETAEELQ